MIILHVAEDCTTCIFYLLFLLVLFQLEICCHSGNILNPAQWGTQQISRSVRSFYKQYHLNWVLKFIHMASFCCWMWWWRWQSWWWWWWWRWWWRWWWDLLHQLGSPDGLTGTTPLANDGNVGTHKLNSMLAHTNSSARHKLNLTWLQHKCNGHTSTHKLYLSNANTNLCHKCNVGKHKLNSTLAHTNLTWATSAMHTPT